MTLKRKVVFLTVPLSARKGRSEMGLLDFLRKLLTGESNTMPCPNCGVPGALRADDGRISCRNPTCSYFDAGRSRGNYAPEHPITIRYRNFAGQERTFSAERESIVRKRNHLVAQVAPTGLKITLSRDRILNLREVESVLPQKIAPGQAWPTVRERQILGYHKLNGTTSPRFEEIRRKYPNW